MFVFFWLGIGFLITFTIIVIAFVNLNNFPAPTGRYGVGTTELHLIDTNRKEANNPNFPRELMLHIWYPTSIKTESPKILYNADAIENYKEFIQLQSTIPAWLLTGFQKTKIYARHNAVLVNGDLFPVIIVSHGSGPMIQQYTWLTEELASQGYIVIGINHPYMAARTRFPDGRCINSLMTTKRKEGKEIARAWKQEQFETAAHDIAFVLNSISKFDTQSSWMFYKKLDLDHIGMAGHSSGGALTMYMCLKDARIKAGVAFDSGLRGNLNVVPLHTPFLEIVAKKSRIWADDEGKIESENLNRLCRASQNMTIIALDNIGHNAFTDLPLLLHETLLGQLLSKFIDVDLNASSVYSRKMQNITKKYTTDFFDKYLKNKPSLSPDN